MPFQKGRRGGVAKRKVVPSPDSPDSGEALDVKDRKKRPMVLVSDGDESGPNSGPSNAGSPEKEGRSRTAKRVTNYKEYLSGSEESSEETSGEKAGDKHGSAASTENETPAEPDSHKDFCHVCDDGGELLCCDSCPRVFHIACAGMKGMPRNPKWKCPVCKEEENAPHYLCYECKGDINMKEAPKAGLRKGTSPDVAWNRCLHCWTYFHLKCMPKEHAETLRKYNDVLINRRANGDDDAVVPGFRCTECLQYPDQVEKLLTMRTGPPPKPEDEESADQPGNGNGSNGGSGGAVPPSPSRVRRRHDNRDAADLLPESQQSQPKKEAEGASASTAAAAGGAVAEGKSGDTSEWFYVKWSGRSHRHNSWVPDRWIQRIAPNKVTSFKRRIFGRPPSIDDVVRAEWLEPERILDTEDWTFYARHCPHPLR